MVFSLLAAQLDLKAAAAEFLAMTLFVIIGCGVACGHGASDGETRLVVAFAFGLCASVLLRTLKTADIPSNTKQPKEMRNAPIYMLTLAVSKRSSYACKLHLCKLDLVRSKIALTRSVHAHVRQWLVSKRPVCL